MPRLTLPLPPNELRENRARGVHWGSFKRIKAEYQETCKREALGQWVEWRGKPEPVWPVTLTATVYLGYRMRCDEMDIGGWLKPGLDALVNIGVWPDDGSKYIHWGAPIVRRDWRKPRVVLEW